MTKKHVIWWFVGAFFILSTALGLAACAAENAASDDVPHSPEYVFDRIVHLSDGRSVVCVFYDPPTAANGALSCDWANAK